MGLFREQALAAYANPDARGGLVRAAPPSGLAIFSVIAGALLCATSLAATTPVSTAIEGRGVVALEHGPVIVRAPRDAVVTTVLVRAGAQLDRAVYLLALDGELLAAPTTGHVEFVDVREGDVVTRGTPLVEIVPDREPLTGYLLVPTAERHRVSEGQTVQLRVAGTVVGSGRIVDVAAQPISQSRESSLFGAPSQARASSVLVRVAVPRVTALANGTVFVGEIPLESRSALSVLVPALRAEADDAQARGSDESAEDADDEAVGSEPPSVPGSGG